MSTNYRTAKKGVFMRDNKEEFQPTGKIPLSEKIAWFILTGCLCASLVLLLVSIISEII